MSATHNEGTIIPGLLGEMVRKVVRPELAKDGRGRACLDYVCGWIEGRAEVEYKTLLIREGLVRDSDILSLLCELAVTRALVRWHEVRDSPPPMPSLDGL